jgi:hypothetical protein
MARPQIRPRLLPVLTPPSLKRRSCLSNHAGSCCPLGDLGTMRGVGRRFVFREPVLLELPRTGSGYTVTLHLLCSVLVGGTHNFPSSCQLASTQPDSMAKRDPSLTENTQPESTGPAAAPFHPSNRVRGCGIPAQIYCFLTRHTRTNGIVSNPLQTNDLAKSDRLALRWFALRVLRGSDEEPNLAS